eukprot:augustus_masked-scaffold_8-processed-gene-9.16-mRNA-1 protein AED:1.00 eAED:1.00 QI:0/0/0/0/1/1/2/0/304
MYWGELQVNKIVRADVDMVNDLVRKVEKDLIVVESDVKELRDVVILLIDKLWERGKEIELYKKKARKIVDNEFTGSKLVIAECSFEKAVIANLVRLDVIGRKLRIYFWKKPIGARTCRMRVQDYLAACTERFPIVTMDPPYRIFSSDPVRGPQILYNTMSDADISLLNLEKLGRNVLFFIWKLPSKKEVILQLMKRNGIEHLERFLWVKMSAHEKVVSSQGVVTGSCTEECLIGLVGEFPRELKTRFFGKELIFGVRAGISCKPVEFYERIDSFCIDGVIKLDLFARNNNLRKVWLSVGDEVML